MKALLVVAALASPLSPSMEATSAPTADSAFADAYAATAANTLCQKDMFNISLGLKLYAQASGITNPETVAGMVARAALAFEQDLVAKGQVKAFCQTMRAFVSRKGKPL